MNCGIVDHKGPESHEAENGEIFTVSSTIKCQMTKELLSIFLAKEEEGEIFADEFCFKNRIITCELSTSKKIVGDLQNS